ncbi:hypothetical protein SDC9_17956 [bioreactor metagenome]|uniref:DUF3987 domain-containing protein n=1 Tax=bioreactor metagenome TaxID=1076179 RepID=A0A644TYU5_9ZZZZ|nr:DUF3987 domain-containing protein [Lentimicrobium sp.]MEA5110950.1 DUF3987 domain-containing protein [Lentimicrobium sp.]
MTANNSSTPNEKNKDSSFQEAISNHIRDEFDNDFPISSFPDPVQEIIRACNEFLKFPTDFIGASILFAASLAIGNTHRVKINNAWYEKPLLYVALVGRPGTMKTPPLRFAIDPILTKDKQQYEKFKQEKRQFKRELKQGLEPETEPKFNKTVVSDFTPEALADIHFYNQRGLGVYSDELNQWLKNFNRYNSGSAQEFWLSVYSGTQISIDRKNQDPVLITEPFVSVCGGIQTAILHELAKDNRAQNGFIDRLLFAFPEYLSKEIWSESEMPTKINKQWNIIINNLLDMPLSTDNECNIKSKTIEFNPFAFDELRKWQIKNSEVINETSSDQLAGIYSKLEIYVIRLSLVIELLNEATKSTPEYKTLPDIEKMKWLYRAAVKLCHPDKNNSRLEIAKELNNAKDAGDLNRIEAIYLELVKPQISVDSVNKAIRLIEYFRYTAKRVNSILINAPVQGLDQRRKELYLKLPETFSTDQALRIAYNSDFPERTLKRWLTDNTYFEKLVHGKYRKLY